MLVLNKLILFYLSPCLLALAHCFAPALSPLVLFCYAPLLVEAVAGLLSIKRVFFWWALFFCCHSCPLIQALFLHSYQFCMPAGALAILLVITAIQAAVVFSIFLNSLFFLSTFLGSAKLRLVRFTAATAAVFFTLVFIDRYSFYWCGVLQGYGPAHPLVPFMAHESLRTLIFFSGSYCGLVFIVLSNFFVACAHSFATKIIAASCSLLLYCAALFLLPTHQLPPLSVSISCGALPFRPDAKQTAAELVDLLSREVNHLRQLHPAARYLLFPESTFPLSVDHYPNSMARLQAILPEGITLIFGGHIRKGERLFSAVIELTAEKVTPLAYKKELLFLAETVPPLFRYFFTNNKNLFCKPAVSELDKTDKWEFFICSELFLGHKSPLVKRELCVVLVNDAWFAGTLYPDMLRRTAQFKALAFFDKETKKRIPLVYCSYTKSDSIIIF